MAYTVVTTDKAEKQILKLDKPTIKLIRNWITKNLIGMEDPRTKGKALKGNFQGIWRYRVGDYRLLAEIKDNELLIFLFEVEHRSKIYK